MIFFMRQLILLFKNYLFLSLNSLKVILMPFNTEFTEHLIRIKSKKTKNILTLVSKIVHPLYILKN